MTPSCSRPRGCRMKSADQSQDRIVRRLLLAASGRREYASSAIGKRQEDLMDEAATFEKAAEIAQGDTQVLRDLIPSWWPEDAS